jgi:hypothetical protein
MLDSRTIQTSPDDQHGCWYADRYRSELRRDEGSRTSDLILREAGTHFRPIPNGRRGSTAASSRARERMNGRFCLCVYRAQSSSRPNVATVEPSVTQRKARDSLSRSAYIVTPPATLAMPAAEMVASAHVLVLGPNHEDSAGPESATCSRPCTRLSRSLVRGRAHIRATSDLGNWCLIRPSYPSGFRGCSW